MRPFVTESITLNHFGLHFWIITFEKLMIHVVPLPHKLTVFLSNDKIIFIGQMPIYFRVSLCIDCPVKHSTHKWMEL